MPAWSRDGNASQRAAFSARGVPGAPGRSPRGETARMKQHGRRGVRASWRTIATSERRHGRGARHRRGRAVVRERTRRHRQDSVKVGFISSETGVAAANFVRAPTRACQARIDAENAKGGVNGRKINLESIDDKSSGATSPRAKDLVENQRRVRGGRTTRSFAFLDLPLPRRLKVPMIGGGFDGSYYYDQGNEDIDLRAWVTARRSRVSPRHRTNADEEARRHEGRRHRLRRLAVVERDRQGHRELRGRASGLKPGVPQQHASTSAAPTSDRSCSASRTRVPTASTCRSTRTRTSPSSRGSQQNGVDMKANVLATGYSQDLLDQPIAKTITPHDVLQSSYKPVELNDPAIKKFVDNLKKYAGVTGVPTTACTPATSPATWPSSASRTPARTRPVRASSTASARPTSGIYDSAGLTCKPIDLSYAHYGKIASTAGRASTTCRSRTGSSCPTTAASRSPASRSATPPSSRSTPKRGHRRGHDHRASVDLNQHCVT